MKHWPPHNHSWSPSRASVGFYRSLELIRNQSLLRRLSSSPPVTPYRGCQEGHPCPILSTMTFPIYVYHKPSFICITTHSVIEIWIVHSLESTMINRLLRPAECIFIAHFNTIMATFSLFSLHNNNPHRCFYFTKVFGKYSGIFWDVKKMLKAPTDVC